MNQQNILHYIPQRPPFVFIDEVLAANDFSSKSSFTIKDVGLFIRNGLFTESGLVENMAQTAAAGVGYRVKNEGLPVQIGYIGAIKNLVVHQLPRVQETIITEVILQNQVFNAQIVLGKIWLNEQEIASCEFKIFLQSEIV